MSGESAGGFPASKFLLSEKDTQSLTAPLGSSGRIKYTCVALSSRYLALGANTGGVYCFHRDHRYIQLLANKEGSVSVVRFSPDEQFLAVVAGGGYLLLWELHLSDSGVSKRLHVAGLLREAVVRDLVWDGRSARVFFGDSQGRVAVANLPKLAMKSSLFRRPNELIFQDKSPVVQLDLSGDLLLVSTHSRTVLLRLTSASREAVQVGKKARDGPFGACFDMRQRKGRKEDRELVVYSARPGGRLWQADLQGEVQATVKLRGLSNCPASPVLGHGFNPEFPISPPQPPLPPSLPLPYLHTLHNGHCLVSADDTGLFLWQPSSWQLTTWTADLPGVVGVACDGGRSDEGSGEGVTVCVLVEEGRKVLVVTVAGLARCLQCLVKDGLMEQAAKVVCAFSGELVALLPSHRPLHPSLSTLLQHTLTNSPTHELPMQFKIVQLELQRIEEEQEKEKERERSDVSSNAATAQSDLTRNEAVMENAVEGELVSDHSADIKSVPTNLKKPAVQPAVQGDGAERGREESGSVCNGGIPGIGGSVVISGHGSEDSVTQHQAELEPPRATERVGREVPTSCEGFVVTDSDREEEGEGVAREDRRNSLEGKKVNEEEEEEEIGVSLGNEGSEEKRGELGAMGGSMNNTAVSISEVKRNEEERVSDLVLTSVPATEDILQTAQLADSPTATLQDTQLADSPTATLQDTQLADSPTATLQDTQLADSPTATLQDTQLTDSPTATLQDTQLADSPTATLQGTQLQVVVLASSTESQQHASTRPAQQQGSPSTARDDRLTPAPTTQEVEAGDELSVSAGSAGADSLSHGWREQRGSEEMGELAPELTEESAVSGSHGDDAEVDHMTLQAESHDEVDHMTLQAESHDEVDHMTLQAESHDIPLTHGRTHRKSNSWSGVPEYITSADTPPEVDEDIFEGEREGVWSSFSENRSHHSTESRETSVSQDPFSLASLESSTEQPAEAPPSFGGVSQAVLTGSAQSLRPQTRSMPSSLENHSGETLMMAALQTRETREEGERGARWEGERGARWEGERPRTERSQSLQLMSPLKPRIAMATLPDHNSDDVIAVPVRSTAASEAGGKLRSKRRSRRSKKSHPSLSSSLPPNTDSPSTESPNTATDSPSTALTPQDAVPCLVHIPEEDILPFPDAGLPTPDPSLPPSPPHETEGVLQMEEQDPAHMLQRGSSFVSKMKELAKQGGQNMGLEPEALQEIQEALNQPVRKVKELLSSLAASPPTALSIPPSQTVFMNEDYVTPQPLPIEDTQPTASVDRQSDCGVVSPDTSSPARQAVSPETTQEVKEDALKTITMETVASLAEPSVYCSAEELRSVLGQWLRAVEAEYSGRGPLQEDSVKALLLSIEENTLVDLLTLSLEVGVYGSQDGFVPYLCRYSVLLHGMRTLVVLGMQKWGVRGEGWRVLVENRERRGEGGEMVGRKSPEEIVKELLTQQNARAPDLPSYLSSLLTSDPEALVRVCVQNWPTVRPWQVALLCSTDQSDHSVESHDTGSEHGLDIYTSYLTQLLGNSEGVGEEVGCDEEMVLALLETVLVCGPSLTQLAGKGGQPREWSHRCCWPYSSLLHSLVDMCVSMTTQHLSKACSLCEDYGYWVGVAQLAVARGDRGKALLVILSLRDTSLLQGNQKWGDLLQTVSDWQTALQVMIGSKCHVISDDVTSDDIITGSITKSGVSASDMSNTENVKTDKLSEAGSHGDELTLSRLVFLMVERVGPALSSHILASVGGARGVASDEQGAELHSLMVQLAAIHAKQKAVARSLLEKVDRYLWSRQPSALSPQLQLVEEREREARRSGDFPSEQQDLFQIGMEWRPTIEDSGRHWGVRVDGGGGCGVCKCSLSAVVSDLQPGVLLFHCGHAYHRHCIPELACYLCFKKNYTEHFMSKLSTPLK